MNEQQRLLDEAVRAAALGNEFARFNAERAIVLRGVPPKKGERMPLPRSGVGGDVEVEG